MFCSCTLRRTLSCAILVAAFAAGTGIPSLALANNNAGLRTIPLTIANKLNQTANLYVLILGQINSDNGLGFPVGTNVYVTDAQGDVAITPAIPGNAPQSLSLNVGAGTVNQLTLPKLSAVRIYSSVGAGLLVHTGGIKGSGLVLPTVQDPSDPNFNTIFDFTELTWVHQAPIQNHPEITSNLGINVTEVDAFGIPQQFTIEGTDPTTFAPTALSSGFLSTASRPTLLNTLQNFGPPWSNLIVGNGVRVRALAPNLGIAAGLFPSDQLDNYTSQVFSTYASSLPIKTTVNVCSNPDPNFCDSVTYNFTGSTVNGELVFSDPNQGGAIFSFKPWSTLNAYAGSFPYGSIQPARFADQQAGLAVQAKLQGALMRTTLVADRHLDGYCNDPSQFYVNAPVNMYAQLWHTAGINDKAYGFGFDDTCNQSSFKLIFNPTGLSITLLGNRS
jgi:hypothetical protein